MNTVRSKDGTPIAFDRSGKRPGAHPRGRRALLSRLRPERTAGGSAGRSLHRLHLRSPRPRRQRRHGTVRSRSGNRRPRRPDSRGRRHPRSSMASRPAPRWPSKRPAAACAIPKLALYESPCIVDDTHAPLPPDFLARLNGPDRSESPRATRSRCSSNSSVYPASRLLMMPLLPAWSKLKAVAHTLPYDITIVQDNQRGKPFPTSRWAGATMPTLAMDGSKSPPGCGTG